MSTNLFAVLVRPGKTSKTQAFNTGDTLESVLVAAGITGSDYRNWTFTDEDGDTLSLSDTLHRTSTIICGQRVDGATA